MVPFSAQNTHKNNINTGHASGGGRLEAAISVDRTNTEL